MHASTTLLTGLRNARKRRKLSQTDLAERVGVSLHTVHRWEAGTHPPSLLSLLALARALDLRPIDLMPVLADYQE